MRENQTADLSASAKTALHSLHLELGAKLVTFAGYKMPLQYSTGIIAEHEHTREHAGLFDISHMGQIRITGTNAALELEKLVPSDILGLLPDQQRYTVFTTHEGGVLDDLMIINLGDSYLLIVNGVCKQTDYEHLQQSLAKHCTIEMLTDQSLLALQGPSAREILTSIFPNISKLAFMEVANFEFKGNPCLITCSGYTGEDGFEISIPSALAEDMARLLLKDKEVLPIGLGARDSLRLEAGHCLYGHDLNTNISPVEAGLSWVIGKSRRIQGVRAGGYIGAEIITKQIKLGSEKIRIGILPEGKAPIREGAILMDEIEQSIGIVTSGTYSPSLHKPIAMGYVLSKFAKPGLQIFANVRGKQLAAKTTKLPFIPTRYFKKA